MSQGLRESSTMRPVSKGNTTNVGYIREIAIEKLKEVLGGKANLNDIHAFCKVADVILETLKVEISYLKMAKKPQDIDFLNPPKVIEHKA